MPKAIMDILIALISCTLLLSLVGEAHGDACCKYNCGKGPKSCPTTLRKSGSVNMNGMMHAATLEEISANVQELKNNAVKVPTNDSLDSVVAAWENRLNQTIADFIANMTNQSDAFILELEASVSNAIEIPVEMRNCSGLEYLDTTIKGVFHVVHEVGQYQYSYAEAEARCSSLGARIATLAELTQAQELGYSCCSCGWLALGEMYYPMSYNKTGCRRIGLNICDWLDKSDVFCYRGAGNTEERVVENRTCYRNEHVDTKLEGVFHVVNESGLDQYSYSEGVARCSSHGARISTVSELSQAQELGYSCCACGWVYLEEMYYPMTHNVTGCGRIGMNICHGRNKSDAYCYRDRPENCGMVCNDVISGKRASEAVGFATSGVSQTIFPSFNTDEGVLVYCDCTNGPEEAWTVFQRRMDGSVDFFRNWSNYTHGFGDVSGELWLGLQALSDFTAGGDYELRVDLRDWEGNTAFAEYRSFAVGNASTGFGLTVGNYTGSAGDSLTYHNGMMFSAFDADNDGLPPANCAETYRGAWWYAACYRSSLNGEYFPNSTVLDPTLGVRWIDWNGNSYSLKASEMKFRKRVSNSSP